MRNDETIQIVICVDDNYVIPTVALLNSICETNSGTCFIFHIVTSQALAAPNKDILSETIVRNGAIGHIYPFDNQIADELPVMKSHQPKHITVSAYYRLFLSRILSDDIDKVLYLDCDIIVNGSIKELWNIDISECAVGVVPDMDEGNLNIYRRLRYAPSYGYFNSGVLLINLKYWREHDLLNSFLKFWRDYPERVVYHDQDILNFVLKGQKLLLPIKFNVQTPALYKLVNISWEYDAELEEALRAPVIIHYTTSDKPWIRGCQHPWKFYFQKYLRGLPIPKALQKKTGSKKSVYQHLRLLLIRLKILKTHMSFREDL